MDNIQQYREYLNSENFGISPTAPAAGQCRFLLVALFPVDREGIRDLKTGLNIHVSRWGRPLST